MIRALALLISGFVLSNCTSTTMIRSERSGAKVYADGIYLGRTPVSYSDQKIVGAVTQIRIQEDGCEPQMFNLTRSEHFEVGPCIGGVFVLVPFLWVMGYNPEHTYELECKGAGKKT